MNLTITQTNGTPQDPNVTRILNLFESTQARFSKEPRSVRDEMERVGTAFWHVMGVRKELVRALHTSSKHSADAVSDALKAVDWELVRQLEGWLAKSIERDVGPASENPI
jgi:hypothetical protein